MQLLGSSKKDVDQDKDGEDVPKLESDEVVLVHYNLINKNYQQASKVLFTFVPNKQFEQLINIRPHSLTLFRMGFFGAAHGSGGGSFLAPLPKIRHTYPAMMKLGTVIPDLRKLQRL